LVVHDQPDEIQFVLETKNSPETALILGEFYRRSGTWKFRAIGQGFLGGLGLLAKNFGVDIKDDPDQPPPALTPAPAPVRLEKITLEKKTPISLEKKGTHFGEILINLNWIRQTPQKSGFLRSKQNGNIDLDIGCMFECHDGYKMVVQALGGNFGSFDDAPWVQLMGDDRTGASNDGENLRINGRYWTEFKRVLVFAFIYEGVPNWASADAIVTIKTQDQPDLIVNIDSHSNRHNMCAIALLENERGNLKITKQVNYYSDHEDLDKAYKFGFRWVAGSK
jgi:tellurite resistance protein TerA